MDNKGNLTKAGQQALSRVESYYNTPKTQRSQLTPMGITVDFYKFRNGLSLSSKDSPLSRELGYFDNTGKPTVIDDGQGQDSYVNKMVRVQRIPVRGENASALLNEIRAAIPENGRIYGVGNLDEKGRKIGHGDSFSKKDFNNKTSGDDALKIVYIGNNPSTNQQFFKMSDGNWYHMPAGVYGNEAIEALSANNQLLQDPNISPTQAAVYGNNAYQYSAQPLTFGSGTEQKPYSGTVSFPLE